SQARLLPSIFPFFSLSSFLLSGGQATAAVAGPCGPVSPCANVRGGYNTPHDLSGVGPQMAAAFIRYAGRTRTRRACADARPVYAAAASRLALHRHAGGGQNHLVAH